MGACILGYQLELLTYLVENTKRSIVEDTSHEGHVIRYVLDKTSQAKEKYYWKSRRGKDKYGNNTMHYVFLVKD